MKPETPATDNPQEQPGQAGTMEAIGRQTAGMAHDYNNLLGVIIGNLDLLQTRLEDPELLELLNSALRAALRGAELTRRLLTMARKQHASGDGLKISLDPSNNA